MLWILPALTSLPNLVTGCHSFSSDLLPPRLGPRRPLPRSPRPLSPRPRSPKPPRPRGASAILEMFLRVLDWQLVLCRYVDRSWFLVRSKFNEVRWKSAGRAKNVGAAARGCPKTVTQADASHCPLSEAMTLYLHRSWNSWKTSLILLDRGNQATGC